MRHSLMLIAALCVAISALALFSRAATVGAGRRLISAILFVAILLSAAAAIVVILTALGLPAFVSPALAWTLVTLSLSRLAARRLPCRLLNLAV